MEIEGAVHCFFEQSGTFKNTFKEMGIKACGYDIQNNFGETDFQIDLFAEIEKGYAGEPSIFDNIGKDDLIFAFFPCVHFCDAKTLFFKGVHANYRGKTVAQIMRKNIELAREREKFFELLLKLVCVVDEKKLRLIVENPYNINGQSYLQNNFIAPSFIDKNRMERGDVFKKPTAYWYFNCEPTFGESWQKDKEQKIISKCKNAPMAGLCSEERSLISSDYARNFIKDFILGTGCKEQTLFDFADNSNLNSNLKGA